MAGALKRSQSLDTRTNNQSPRSSNHSSYESGSDDMDTEGLDYVFDPPLPDTRYDCPICLLVLREPCQTTCGHRFCRVCITRWLREQKSTCPIDNELLMEHQLFTDNFAKREIMVLTVKCPNYESGCPLVLEVNKVMEHRALCQHSLQPCPYQCSTVLLRKDLRDHVKFKCSKRTVVCQYCEKSVVFEQLQDHVDRVCPLVPTKCKYCDITKTKHQLTVHMATECQKALVSCVFSRMGCNKQIERYRLDDHMENAAQEHIQLLCTTVNRLVTIIESLTGKPWNEFESMQNSNYGDHISSSLVDSGYVNQQASVLLKDGNGVISDRRRQSTSLHEYVLPTREAVHAGINLVSDVNQLRSVASDPMTSTFQERALQDWSSHQIDNRHQLDAFLKTEKAVLDLREKCFVLTNGMTSAKQTIKTLENQISNFEMRNCNGTYIWPVSNYARLRRDALTGQTTVIHSSGFYTSLYGYKVCIRLNLNGVDSATGTHISLFIHFMKGEYDYLLDWPFHGKITLSIIDQNEVCEVRQHISETLVAKPHLAAFQKPTSSRNHKGFGYMEFAPLSIVENASYIKGDTLIVKVKVMVDD